MFSKKENGAVAAIVAIAITILSMYYLSQSQFIQIIQSYNIFGLFVLFFIPFLIFGVLLHMIGQTPTIRRIGWIAFGIIFIYLYEKSEYVSNDTGLIIAIIIIVIAMIFDSAIHEGLRKEPRRGGGILIPAGSNWRWN